MRIAWLLIVSSLVSAPAFAGMWSNLWHTPNQQGEALLAGGHPAQAAARFTSPRRKAYADLRAGRYRQAAHLLAPFKDATSEYNRGNALAHIGKLRAALAAYDSALKRAPHDEDIRHNRNLLARILKRRQQHRAHRRGHSGKSGGATRRGPHSGHGTKSGHGQNQPRGHGGQTRRGTQHGAPERHGKRQGTTAHQSPGSPRSGAHRSGHGSTPRASNGATGRGRQPAAPSAGSGTHAHKPAQTRRNAARAAALARRQQHHANTARAGTGAHHGTRSSARPLVSRMPRRGSHGHKPPSEKTPALDQWLRQIPNNPAGLLRRKFLIEYMLRHPGANP